MPKVKSLTPFHEEYLADTVAQIRDLYFFGIDEDKIQYDCYKGDNERILYEEKAVISSSGWEIALKYLTDKKPNMFDSYEEIPEYLKACLSHQNEYKVIKFTEYPDCWELFTCTKHIKVVHVYKKKKWVVCIRKLPIHKLTITKSGYARYRSGKNCWYVSPKILPQVISSSPLTNLDKLELLQDLLCSLNPNNEWVRKIFSVNVRNVENLPSGPMFRTFSSYKQYWEHMTGYSYIPNISVQTILNLNRILTKEQLVLFINREDVQRILIPNPHKEFDFTWLYSTILKLAENNKHINSYTIVCDCVRMARVLREPIKLKIKSWSKMLEWHEKLRKRYLLRDLEDIQVDPVYPTLNADCSYVIEKIETKERLAKEAIELHHCVNSYTDRINSGDCAIYSILDGKQRYTAEVVHENQQFKLRQLRGNCNSAPPPELEEFLTKLLDQVSKEMKAKKNK